MEPPIQTPLVTIVVPAYRRLNYLRHAMPSALNQTFRDFELILSDDGASDEIAAYAASLADPRIHYRCNEKNLGIAMNNYAAFQAARGKYIASLHDDDVWEPRFLEAAIPPLEADGTLSVAFSDHSLIDENGRFIPERTDANSRLYRRHGLKPGRHQPFIEPAVIGQTIPIVMAGVFRKSILQNAEYPKRIGLSYDHWLAYLSVKEGQAVYYIPERLTRYRVHNSSGTARGGTRYYRDAIYVRTRFLTDPRLAPSRFAIRNGLGVLYGKLALYYLVRNRNRRGLPFLRRAFRLLNHPKNIAALAVNAFLATCGCRRQ